MLSPNLLVNALRGALIPPAKRREEEAVLAAQQAEAEQQAQVAQLLEVLKQSGRSGLQSQRDDASAGRLEFTEEGKALRLGAGQEFQRERGDKRSLDTFLRDPESITDALIGSVSPEAQELLRGARSRGDELRTQEATDAEALRGRKERDKIALEDRRSANISARQQPKKQRAGSIVIPDSRQFAQDVNDLAVNLVDTGQVRLDPENPDAAITTAMDRTLRANFGLTLEQIQALGVDISNPLAVFEEAVAEFQSRRGDVIPPGLRPQE